jgi:hypothetical protein
MIGMTAFETLPPVACAGNFLACTFVEKRLRMDSNIVRSLTILIAMLLVDPLQ